MNGPVSPRRDILRDWTRTYLVIIECEHGNRQLRNIDEGIGIYKSFHYLSDLFVREYIGLNRYWEDQTESSLHTFHSTSLQLSPY